MEPQNLPTNVSSPVPIQPAPGVQTVAPLPQTPNIEQPLPLVEVEASPAFYKNWLFYVFVFLVLSLVVVVYFLATTFIIRPFSVSVSKDGGVPKIHVLRLDAPDSGFVVVQADDNGILGNLFETSHFIVQDKYSDFYIPFTYDETNTQEFYLNLLSKGTFYVSFYKDVNKNGNFDQSVDTVIPKDMFGKSLQVKIVDGVPR